MHLVFNALYLLVLVFVSPWILYRSIRQGRYRVGWREKLLGDIRLENSELPTVWLHAVSVGEVQLLRTIVHKLEEERPDLRLVITVATDSGISLAKQLFPKHVVRFAPLDFSWSIRRAWNRIRPVLIVLIELEIWPNWLRCAERYGCPVAIINARLSAKSFRGYHRWKWWIQPMLQSIDWIGAQNTEYATRFLSLGAVPERVHVTGSLKFDNAHPDRRAPQVLERRHWLSLPSPSESPATASPSGTPILWVAGSTQSPEEQIVFDTFCSLLARHPSLKLLIVPRHAERFEEVSKLMESTGLPSVRRSQWLESPPPADWKICLGDTVGELRWWWGLADIAFVGGSFGDRGGQNMIEPCAYGVATCFGPNTRNFADIVRILRQADGCVPLESPEELQTWVEKALLDADYRRSLGDNAKRITAEHRGAIDRTWKGISSLLPPATSSSFKP